jgi:hypothetical protein
MEWLSLGLTAMRLGKRFLVAWRSTLREGKELVVFTESKQTCFRVD